VNRHEVDAVRGVLLDGLENIVGGHVDQRALALDGPYRRLINRHRAHRYRAVLDYGPADGLKVAAGAQIHHRVGFIFDGNP
jgi:hypothetical protein